MERQRSTSDHHRYIVVHELCQLRHRDHTSAFWNEVNEILPDYQRRKEWLRARGVEPDL